MILNDGAAQLEGRLLVPEAAQAVVVFAHGSGSSRHSPRNQYVAGILNAAGLGTLLFDLLTVSEETDRSNVFNIGLLGGRLVAVTRWLREQPETNRLEIGYFGASTGAAAALWAAAELDAEVMAVVSRGGRPDLAGDRLDAVIAPTLLIVGGDDDVVLGLNHDAQAKLRCESRLVVVPGATHLFEEPGTLEVVAEKSRDWFVTHLRSTATFEG
ncbi:MAG: dienelactone hydrolase family protein [Acidimicrobiales bacterium]